MSLAVKSTNDDLNRDRNNSERKEVQIIGVEPLGKLIEEKKRI